MITNLAQENTRLKEELAQCMVVGKSALDSRIEYQKENVILKERVAELEKSIDAMMSNQAVKDAKIFKLEQRIADLEEQVYWWWTRGFLQ